MVFHKTSQSCYEWLAQQPHVKEESITDWLLYYCSYLHHRIYYHAFSRNEEAQNGSDWEWWILTEYCSVPTALRLLIQAKKLKPNCDNYPLITYSNKNGMQIDLLIEAAKKRNALPLYAYYSCCHPDFNQQCKNIDYVPTSLLKWCGNCLNGCFLTSAFDLQKNIFTFPRKKIYDEELINSSFALSIFDILFINQSNEVSRDFLVKLNDHYMDYLNKNNYGDSNILYNIDDLPGYVRTLINSRNQDLSWLENEFRHELDDLSGIVVIDTRNNI